jgi:hypothetical protein
MIQEYSAHRLGCGRVKVTCPLPRFLSRPDELYEGFVDKSRCLERVTSALRSHSLPRDGFKLIVNDRQQLSSFVLIAFRVITIENVGKTFLGLGIDWFGFFDGRHGLFTKWVELTL